MRFSLKYILFCLIILLLVTNITTIAIIVYHQNHSHNTAIVNQNKSVVDNNMPRGLFFKERLGLSDKQYQVFRGLHQKYNRTANGIMADLNNKRQQMVEELGREDSDTIVLQSLAKEIGQFHETLKKMTIDYYLNMKANSSEEQKQALFEIFNAILNNDGNVEPPRYGRQKRGGGKHGNNN